MAYGRSPGDHFEPGQERFTVKYAPGTLLFFPAAKRYALILSTRAYPTMNWAEESIKCYILLIGPSDPEDGSVRLKRDDTHVTMYAEQFVETCSRLVAV